MLLAYYGINTPLDGLIRECNTRAIGCTGKDIMQAGRAHGLDMTAWRMDAAELIQQDRPAIVWCGYCHMCVFSGTDEAGSVTLCDPDRGRTEMTKAEFGEYYSGIAFFNGIPEDREDEVHGKNP